MPDAWRIHYVAPDYSDDCPRLQTIRKSLVGEIWRMITAPVCSSKITI
ncbi:hypothetical protein [Paraburkholderia fungorum]